MRPRENKPPMWRSACVVALLLVPSDALQPRMSIAPKRPRAGLVAAAAPVAVPPALAAEALGTGIITLLGTGCVSAAVFHMGRTELTSPAVVAIATSASHERSCRSSIRVQTSQET